jgi:hypothetical protein
LVFLSISRRNLQAHGYTGVPLHLVVFRVSYFHKEQRCKKVSLASSPKKTRRRVAWVVRFF